jgi:hypothetical protein
MQQPKSPESIIRLRIIYYYYNAPHAQDAPATPETERGHGRRSGRRTRRVGHGHVPLRAPLSVAGSSILVAHSKGDGTTLRRSTQGYITSPTPPSRLGCDRESIDRLMMVKARIPRRAATTTTTTTTIRPSRQCRRGRATLPPMSGVVFPPAVGAGARGGRGGGGVEDGMVVCGGSSSQ